MSILLVKRKIDNKYAPPKSHSASGKWVDDPIKARFFRRKSDLTQFTECAGLKREQYEIIELKIGGEQTPNQQAPSPANTIKFKQAGDLYEARFTSYHYTPSGWGNKKFTSYSKAQEYISNYCKINNVHKDYFNIITIRADKQRKWDLRFLELAEFISRWSKDPSTKTGAVIVGPNREVVSVGYNGFARNTNDADSQYADRDIKYKRVVHCERNAIIFGDRTALKGSTLYTWPFMSCSVCAGMVIQAGIKRCVAPSLPADKAERWAEDMKLATKDLKDAGITLDIIPLEEILETAIV